MLSRETGKEGSCTLLTAGGRGMRMPFVEAEADEEDESISRRVRREAEMDSSSGVCGKRVGTLEEEEEEEEREGEEEAVWVVVDEDSEEGEVQFV